MFTSTQTFYVRFRNLLLSMLNTKFLLIYQYTFLAIFGAFHASYNHTHLFFSTIFFKEKILIFPTKVSDILLDENCTFQKKQNTQFQRYKCQSVSRIYCQCSIFTLAQLEKHSFSFRTRIVLTT